MGEKEDFWLRRPGFFARANMDGRASATKDGRCNILLHIIIARNIYIIIIGSTRF